MQPLAPAGNNKTQCLSFEVGVHSQHYIPFLAPVLLLKTERLFKIVTPSADS
jgi:hypothetical protein